MSTEGLALISVAASGEATVVPTAQCRRCKRDVPLKATLETHRGGSLKIECDCPHCYAYEMVRILAHEMPTVTSVRVEETPTINIKVTMQEDARR